MIKFSWEGLAPNQCIQKTLNRSSQCSATSTTSSFPGFTYNMWLSQQPIPPPCNVSRTLTTSISREHTEFWRTKRATCRTRLCHCTDWTCIDNHPSLQTVMLQKLFHIGISVRLANIVFPRVYAAATIPAEYGLHGAEPASIEQHGTHALQTTTPLALSLSWRWFYGGMGPRRKASPLSGHSGRETAKSGGYLLFVFWYHYLRLHRCVRTAREQYYVPHKITSSTCI